jgi:hypothetical protein
MQSPEYLAESVCAAAFVCRDYHTGQWSGCYAVQCGSWEYLTADDLRRAADELETHYLGEADEVEEAIADLRAAADQWGAVQAELLS